MEKIKLALENKEKTLSEIIEREKEFNVAEKSLEKEEKDLEETHSQLEELSIELLHELAVQETQENCLKMQLNELGKKKMFFRSKIDKVEE